MAIGKRTYKCDADLSQDPQIPDKAEAVTLVYNPMERWKLKTGESLEA